MDHTYLRLEYLASKLSMSRSLKKDYHFCCQYLSATHQNQLKLLLEEHKIELGTPKKVVEKSTNLIRQTICVFNHPSVATDIVRTYAQMYRDKRFVIIDLDRFNPSINLYMKESPIVKKVTTQFDHTKSTGINLLIDALHKNLLNQSYTDHIAVKTKGCRNLHYFSGSYVLDDYEYFNLEDLKLVTQYLKEHYDVVVLSVNNFIYDAFTCYALLTSSLNVFPLTGDIQQLKEIKTYTEFLERKQKITFEKNVFIGLNNTGTNLNPLSIESILNGHYLGNIQLAQRASHPSWLYHLSKKRFKQLKKVNRKLSYYAKEHYELNQNTSYSN